MQLIKLFIRKATVMGLRAVTIKSCLCQTNFFVKRLINAYYAISTEQRERIIKLFPYVVDVLDVAPSLHDYICNQIQELRLVASTQHREKWSIDGLKNAGLWVSRNEIIEYRRRLIKIIDDIFFILEQDECDIYR